MKALFKGLTTYATGLLIGATVFGGITYASTGARTLDVRYANIKINVDGKDIPTAAEPFIYNNNVYVPISTISHGLGAAVAWVNKTRQVQVTDNNTLVTSTGNLEYYQVPVYWYAQTHSAMYKGQLYISPIALAAALNEPYYIDSATGAFYIGKGPGGHMPLVQLTDVRDYGDYAKVAGGTIGPTTGYSDGPPQIAGTEYPDANGQSIVWSAGASGAVVPGVTYNLNGDYSNISGLFGVDDAADGKNSLQLTLTGDGKVLYQSPWLKKGQNALPVLVNVAGVHLLNVSFTVATATGTPYTAGQTLPSGTNMAADFLNVSVQ